MAAAAHMPSPFSHVTTSTPAAPLAGPTAAAAAAPWQDDHFLPTMTAYEVLSFHAALLVPGRTTAKERSERCADVLGALGLGRQANTLVRRRTTGWRGSGRSRCTSCGWRWGEV